MHSTAIHAVFGSAARGQLVWGQGLQGDRPASNEGLNVIPQLLTKNADEFVWAARELAELGYGGVNLNLGCPSGTVVSRARARLSA
ncbi:MAG: tRNA-dihydrouridine synthase [Collinsella sp.]